MVGQVVLVAVVDLPEDVAAPVRLEQEIELIRVPAAVILVLQVVIPTIHLIIDY